MAVTVKHYTVGISHLSWRAVAHTLMLARCHMTQSSHILDLMLLISPQQITGSSLIDHGPLIPRPLHHA